MQKRFFLTWFPRIFSAIIWLGCWYLAFPRLYRITFNESFIMASFLAAGIFMYDSVLSGSLQKTPAANSEYRLALWGRVVLSVVVAWVGGFAITVSVFLTQVNRYLPGMRANYIQKFRMGLSASGTILLVFVGVVLMVFVLDNLGRFVARLKLQVQTIKAQEKIIEEKESLLGQAYQQQMNIISSIQHELGNKLPIAKNTLGDLKTALHQLEQKQTGFSLQQKIRNRLPGEPENQVDSFADLLHRLESGLFYSISIVDNIRGVIKADPSAFSPQLISLRGWLELETPKHLPSDKQVLLRVEGADPAINADPGQLAILLHNIIGNAIRHGFIEDDTNAAILVQCRETDQNVLCSIHNNGKGLPASFSLEEYLKPGAAIGSTGNSGLGGYLVGMIAANHQASICIGSSEIDGYVSAVHIKFPK